jgi:transposase-like protein
MSKRRVFTPDFKARVVLEGISGLKSTAQICREHQLSSQLLSGWKADFLRRAPEVFASKRRDDEREQIAELQRLVGRLTMELEAAKKVSHILSSHSTGRGR